jgi:crotonobetainyl-CoA:carnitine CoA-transferase CaiB-like acyl-CoA transferase
LSTVIDPSGEGWPHREEFRGVLGRKAREDELDRLMAKWTANWDVRELMGTLQKAGVPAGMVNNPRDLFEDPQLQHRGHFRFLDHPEIGPYASDRSELNLTRTPGDLDMPGPMLGQHTEQVLTEMVGLSQEEYRSLVDDGVLE